MAELASSNTGANGSYSAATAFGFAAAEVRLYNAGTVPARVSWDGSTAAVRLLPGEKRGPLVYDGGDKPTSIQVYGEAGTPQVFFEASAAVRSAHGGSEQSFSIAATSIVYGSTTANAAITTLGAQGRIITLAVGAEAADVITLALTSTDALGAAVTAADRYEVELFEDEARSVPIEPAAYTLTDGGSGSLVATSATVTRALFETTAAGALQVAITDVAGGSDTEVFGKATLVSASPGAKMAAPILFAATFDNA